MPCASADRRLQFTFARLSVLYYHTVGPDKPATIRMPSYNGIQGWAFGRLSISEYLHVGGTCVLSYHLWQPRNTGHCRGTGKIQAFALYRAETIVVY